MRRVARSSSWPLQRAKLIDFWVRQLTGAGYFPVKYRIDGAEHLAPTPAGGAGVFYCSVHLPLTVVVVWGMIDLGYPPDLVLAAPSNITADGHWVSAGAAKAIKALAPGSATLLRARTILRGGGRLAAMADEDEGEPLRPEMMRLAGRLGARVVLCWAAIDDAGEICVTYEPAPYPIPDTEEKVLANLDVLEIKRRSILTEAGLARSLR